MNVTLRQLRVLLETTRSRNFTRTGERIGMTQSAVSHSMRELESALGVKLFDRTTRGKSARWTQLSGRPLVLLDHASGSRQLIDQAFVAQGVRPTVAQELGHSTTVFQMVAAGIGIAVLPMLSLPAPEASGLVARPLTPTVERTLMLAHRKNRSLSPAAETVWQLIGELTRER